ncbi:MULTISPECIES: PQQ-binding-like beta-propeller repeat protein [unclassified Saccharopolyspora]|uniref:outer membrane protein assembly factor BamB family protein n=1 Tax=unclassified Saccharopolyspora TaxID=2646250 RepID=UPI001CD4C1FA|nr:MULTISPECIES: PQQ-binding-like beta-propeller repeat protein [unclassified Saccharopolyspora]MCA1189408.1 PQQ-like beta-propeller repeat protein [Saccharopolyspora sp. 6T]MCA1191247.1 PQQ-like beta-propeller repeat protein [Saccharopolyspora sp. 6V]MCA1228695.1 PQQ-like beta-propeller repeat protein [Saccharopolyspora sp. 6M]MCA1282665.1 PQQ-like beta-propeller repeat protein [Saccharopolyspora sp. 7B]
MAGGGTTIWFATRPPLAAGFTWKDSGAVGLELIRTLSAEGVLVQVVSDEVIGVSEKTGEEKWSFTPPDGTDVCGASDEAVNGLAAIHVGSSRTDCPRVILLDVRSGEQKWTASLARDESYEPVTRVVGDGVVVVDEERVSKLALSDGEPLWSEGVAVDRSCSISPSRVSAPRTVLVRGCADGYELVLVDSASGRTIATSRLENDLRYEVVSADPVVLSARISRDSDAVPSFVFFDEDANRTAEVRGVGSYGRLDTGAAGGMGGDLRRYRAVIGHGLLVTGVKPANDSYADFDEVVAFDLASGAERWRSRVSRNSDVRPFALTERGFIAFDTAVRGGSAQIVELSAANGSITELSPPMPDVSITSEYDLHWDGEAVCGANNSLVSEDSLFCIR